MNGEGGELQLNSPMATRAEYSKFFRAKYWRLLQAAFRSDERRPDYANSEVIANILKPYHQLSYSDSPSAPVGMPRHIWMLWQQGWESAPPLVQACARSFEVMNPGWEVHLIDEAGIAEFAPIYAQLKIPKAARTAQSNIARLCLLATHGGVWADATLFCQRPLDDWLPNAMAADFFMFCEPRPYRYSDIWFLASGAQSPIAARWLEMVVEYWQYFSRPHHYYWMEYLFEFLVSRDPEIAQIWGQVPKLSALGPLVTQGLPFGKSVPVGTLSMLKQRTVPVHKLSHKWKFSKDLAGTPVGILTGMDRL